jgi:hypothetical protein
LVYVLDNEKQESKQGLKLVKFFLSTGQGLKETSSYSNKDELTLSFTRLSI